MKRLVTIFAVFLLTGFITTASAQNFIIENTTGLGAKAGYYKAPDADDGTMFLGAQLRTKGKYLGGEFAVEYRGEQTYTTTGGELTVSQVPVTGSLMAFAPISKNFAPYGLAGLGAYYTIYDYNGTLTSGDDTDITVGYHLGFGADLAINESAAFNVDYRYLFLNGNEDLTEKEYSGNVLSVGLTFYF